MNARKCFRAFMIRLWCVQNGLCPDYRAFKVAYNQTIVRSKLHKSRLSCVQNCVCPDYRAFKFAYNQTIVRSKLHKSRLSCVQNCVCPDYWAFKFAYVQTIVGSFFFPDRVILNARRHLVRSFRSGHIDFRSGTSTWDHIQGCVTTGVTEKLVLMVDKYL